MEKSKLTSDLPETEVANKASRRRFTGKYKLKILAEADACTEQGQIGQLLRREGLYSSHLTNWRKQRDHGQMAGLSSKRRGRKPNVSNPLTDENTRLQRENKRLKEKLRKAELIIDVQKKVAEILGNPIDQKALDEIG
jgi:transposase